MVNVITDAVERLAATNPDPPPPALVLLALMRRLAAIVDSQDTPAYAVPAAARELRAAAAELRALARPVGSDRDQFLRSRGLEPTGDEVLDEFLAEIQSDDAVRGPGD